MRNLRQGIDGGLQPAVGRIEPRARASSLPAEPPAVPPHEGRNDDPRVGLHALPPHRDEVRPLGPDLRRQWRRHSVVGGLSVVGLITIVPRPLVGAILLVTALAVLLDGRGTFGHGRFRAALAFVSGLWVGLAGIVATLLGMFALPGSCDPTTTSCEGPEGNFLFAPGLLLLGLGLTLFTWSVVELLRMRRRPHGPRLTIED